MAFARTDRFSSLNLEKLIKRPDGNLNYLSFASVKLPSKFLRTLGEIFGSFHGTGLFIPSGLVSQFSISSSKDPSSSFSEKISPSSGDENSRKQKFYIIA